MSSSARSHFLELRWRVDILIGILIGVVGLSLAFSGLRVFFAMLPLIGMVAGFFAGATLITNWLGDGFLATMTGWLVGLVFGVLFALVSYLWWYAGALLAAGASGALLLSGIFSMFGMNNGILLTSIAIAGAIIFIVVALVLNLPIYVVLVNTAVVGAHMVVGGLLLILNRVDVEDFDWGVARAIVHDSWFWWLIMVAVAAAGIVAQLQIINRIKLPDDRWSKVEPA